MAECRNCFDEADPRFHGYCLHHWADLGAARRSELLAINAGSDDPTPDPAPVRVVTRYQTRPHLPLWQLLGLISLAASVGVVIGWVVAKGVLR